MLNDLKKKALAATPGPWGELGSVEVEVSCGSYCQGGTGEIVLKSCNGKETTHTWADLEYIAAASPDVVLKLIAVAEAVNEYHPGEFPTAVNDAMAALKAHLGGGDE
jgi:hypothetical protein